MGKDKTVFYCTECGNESPRWLGQCPACGSWNTFKEMVGKTTSVKNVPLKSGMQKKTPKRLNELDSDEEVRFSTGMHELDRVLGGGAVKGSLVLISGAPGIGKSTLLLQICNSICNTCKVLYVSGEESEYQLKLRAQRLHVAPDNLFILSVTALADVTEAVDTLSPDVLIIDSIQTMCNEENDSSPGSVSQVKDCTSEMMRISKSLGVTVFVVGHINKDGNIAGPKVLEHMVDCVLYFEGDPGTSYRLLRSDKNRFGSTNEISVFEMLDTGLVEVPNPSQMLLDGRPSGANGTCVSCVMKGTRPILAEVQALVAKSSLSVPRRACDGFDFNRATLLLAVTEKRAGIRLSLFDAYINVIGGLRLDEPAADLAVVLAVVSSFSEKPIPDDFVAIGEIGLTGEVRSVSHINQRMKEISRLGFTKCVIPRNSSESLTVPAGLTVYRVRNLREAIEMAMPN